MLVVSRMFLFFLELVSQVVCLFTFAPEPLTRFVDHGGIFRANNSTEEIETVGWSVLDVKFSIYIPAFELLDFPNLPSNRSILIF